MRTISLLVLAAIVALAAGLVMSSPGSAAASATSPVPHSIDVNCSGSVDSIDALLVLQFTAGLVVVLDCQGNADANGDGAVNSLDASLILQFIAGLTFKPGAVSTIEEYFAVLADLDIQFEQEVVALMANLDDKLEGLTDQDVATTVVQDYIAQFAAAGGDFADGLTLLPPAPKVVATHHDLIAAMRAFETTLRTVSDALGAAESPEEVLTILEDSVDVKVAATLDYVQVCSELELAAAANAIALDLFCGPV